MWVCEWVRVAFKTPLWTVFLCHGADNEVECWAEFGVCLPNLTRLYPDWSRWTFEHINDMGCESTCSVSTSNSCWWIMILWIIHKPGVCMLGDLVGLQILNREWYSALWSHKSRCAMMSQNLDVGQTTLKVMGLVNDFVVCENSECCVANTTLQLQVCFPNPTHICKPWWSYRHHVLKFCLTSLAVSRCLDSNPQR